MTTINEILKAFPGTIKSEWRQEQKTWIHSDAIINGGVFRGGVFRGGEFRGGVFHGGVFHGGWFRGGVFHGGEFHDGVFHDGVFHDGVFRGGEFRDGVFHGGWFRGGVFRGGEFHDGEFHDGEFRGGWLPLQIQGSSHLVNIPDGENIKIGCIVNTPEWWADNYIEAGVKNGYSPQQIEEYKLYIDLAAAIIKLNKKGKD